MASPGNEIAFGFRAMVLRDGDEMQERNFVKFTRPQGNRSKPCRDSDYQIPACR
jgi:hypothetical protein